MSTFDLIAGSDSETVDSLIHQVYSAVYPHLFKGTLHVGTLKIDSIDFDISSAPTLQLSEPIEIETDLRNALKNNKYGATSHLTPEQVEQLVALTAGVTLTASLPTVGLTIHYTDRPDKKVTGSVSVAVNIQAETANGQNSFTVSIVQAKISLAGNPALEILLQDVFIPMLIGYLNDHLLHAISVPALQFGSLEISLPLPAVQAPYVIAVSALGSSQPPVPAPFAWPTGGVFIGADAALLQAAADIPFPIQKMADFNWDIISGQAGGNISAPTGVTVNNDGSLSAQVTLNAIAQLTLHTPNGFPNVSFGPTASATVGVTLLPSIDGSSFEIKVQGISIPNFSFDWGIPGWINWLFDPLEDALAAALNAVIAPILSGLLGLLPPIKVFTIPEMQLSIGGSSFTVQLTNGSIANVNGLLMISVTPEITSSSVESFARGEAVPA